MRELTTTVDLPELLRTALGAAAEIVGVERLRGGSKKGVYRVRLAGTAPAAVIVYRWAPDEDFWPETGGESPLDPLTPATGLAPYLAAHHALRDAGVRTPELLHATEPGATDPGTPGSPSADLAVVEDLPGGTLESLLADDPTRAATPLTELARVLDHMRHAQSSHYGRVGTPHPSDVGSASAPTPAEQLVLDRALRDLTEAASRDATIHAAHDRLATRLHDLRARVHPRTAYGLVHGELGPDHVLLDADGHPVLIDIEGLLHFDVEWEHTFLRLRFGAHYDRLARPDLDPDRLALYALAQHLSLVTGPLRLLDGDFPDRRAMLGIAAHNAGAALATLE
ncbi:phosphotransferase [Streptomyces sp. DSM 110735]|uniref:phosphotransferase n=1 Tax=Streptomyces sp. DSM 110735 TaxID=2775031 RepID=UPI0018F5E492|nr:phosphotransferase [Streptomyces sp. DSM 110735]MBJ7906658.1 phosphotransferase [Streptomyces sp. DSM 110735]